MSNRNSRNVRNRNSNNFISLNFVKLVGIIIAIITLIILVVFIMKHKNKSYSNISNSNLDKTINYEYFMLFGNESDGVRVIDKSGNLVISKEYSQIYIPNPEKDVFLCLKDDGKYEVLNKNSEKILTNFSDISYIEMLEENMNTKNYILKYKKNDLYGLIDLEGNIISEPIYQEVSKLIGNPYAILVKKNDKYGILNLQGNVIIDAEYDKIISDEYFSEKEFYEKSGYIVANKTDSGINYGYIDYRGKKICDTEYETLQRALIYNDNDIYLIAMKSGKKGVLKNGNELIDFKFQNILYSNVFVVNKNGKYGCYSKHGKIILEPQFKEFSIAGDYILVKDESETKLYDVNGNLINSNNYINMIETENPSYFIAQNQDGTYSIISKDISTQNSYKNIEYAFDNYFIVADVSGKTGLVDVSTNEIKIDFEYDFIIKLNGSKALEVVDSENNLIEIYSNELQKTISMKNAYVDSFEEGMSIIYSENDLKYIDSNGNEIKNTEVDKSKNLHAIKQNNKWGYADENENIVIDCEYDIATEFNKYGFAGIKKDGKWGVVNEEAQIIVEPKYEIETYYLPKFLGKYELYDTEGTCVDLDKLKK